MTSLFSRLALLFLLAVSPLAARAEHENWQEKFDCERAAADADLILVVRVEEVSKLMLIRGGKSESSLYQYRFKPLQVIKGVFAREELSMNSGDLSLGRFSGSSSSRPLAQGDVRLLFLGRNSEGYQNAVQYPGTLDVALPLLRDEHDPLLGVINALLAVNAQPDRARRVDRLIEALRAARGPSVVPLCFALERRALLAAQNPAVVSALVTHLQPDAGEVAQRMAAQTLGRLMDVDYLRRTDLRASSATALAALLDDEAVPAPVRAQAVGTLGETGTDTVEGMPAALAHLRVDPPASTRTEQTTRVGMIGWLHLASQRQSIRDAFLHLPLDEDHYTRTDYARAFARIDPERAVRELPARIRQVLAADAGGVWDLIFALRELPPKSAADALLSTASLPLDDTEKRQWVEVCSEVSLKERYERFIDPLSQFIAQGDAGLTQNVEEALMRIDTARAAEVLRPHLREEANLSQKLRLAEFLGKHGVRDGYPYAIEHLSESYLLERAIAALVAIQEPDAVTRLKTILETSNDLGWRSAAVRALGALKASDQGPRFYEWASDLKNPLAPAALIALADLGDLRIVGKVREGLASRNDGIVTASATAAGKLLASGDPGTADLGDLLANLLADPQADSSPRAAALEHCSRRKTRGWTGRSRRRRETPNWRTAIYSAGWKRCSVNGKSR